jgi:hypothetical protein
MKDKEEVATDVALKRYAIVMGYLTYENNVYWTRSQFFIVANVGLIGFVASRLIDPHIAKRAFLILMSCFGLILSIYWFRIMKSALYWTNRWERICVALEGEAFENIEVLRNCRPKNIFSTKSIVRHTAIAFIVVWSIVLIYLPWAN